MLWIQQDNISCFLCHIGWIFFHWAHCTAIFGSLSWEKCHCFLFSLSLFGSDGYKGSLHGHLTRLLECKPHETAFAAYLAPLMWFISRKNNKIIMGKLCLMWLYSLSSWLLNLFFAETQFIFRDWEIDYFVAQNPQTWWWSSPFSYISAFRPIYTERERKKR